MRIAPALCGSILALLAVPSEARADVSAWLSVSGGTSLITVNESEVKVRGSMAFDVGMGSSPSEPWMFGGLVRVAPIFGEGTDMAFMARGATRGFQVGDWGVAIDLGSYLRLFDASRPGGGFIGDVVLGAPLGFQLTLSGHAGSSMSYGGSATLGLDLLRLLVYRQTLTDYWPNPLSPGKAVAQAPSY